MSEVDWKIGSRRRLRAIEKFAIEDSWGMFSSLAQFKKEFSGQWFTGQIGVLGTSVDVSIKPRTGSGRLVVVFNSEQISGGELRLFTWRRIANLLGCSMLFVADPTLNDSETAVLGGYATNTRGNFQPIIGDIIRTVQLVLNASEVVFIGSSSGAFPAFYYSQQWEDSLALLFTPVFSLERYTVPLPVKHLLREVNRVDDFGQLRLKFPNAAYDFADIIDVSRLMESGKFLHQPVHVLQSINDSKQWNEQCVPLMRYCGLNSEVPLKAVSARNFSAIFGDWSDARRPPPDAEIEKAVLRLRDIPLGKLEEYSVV